MEIVVAVIAGMFSVCVAIFGAILVNVNNTKMQTRKLKEEQYVSYWKLYIILQKITKVLKH